MPWHTSGRFAFSPINAVTHKPYRGVNVLALWAVAQSKGYERGEWATYNQWQERGAQVRKGEKSASVAFWKFANEAAESQDGEQELSSRSRLVFCRLYTCSTRRKWTATLPNRTRARRSSNASSTPMRSFGRVGARVAHQGNRAFYSRPMTRSRYRRSRRSSRQWITIRRGRMKPGIGRQGGSL
jgi:antirestriction protein ArdC